MSEVVTPLHGHTSADSAYLVEDYPYGRTLRCQIRYWLEYKPGKGFRLASQTTNPKAGHTWNKPKYSTYTECAAALYLDENGHVQWRGVGVNTDADKALEFMRLFPAEPFVALRAWSRKKAAFSRALANNTAWFEINGARQKQSEADIQESTREADTWDAIVAELEKRAAP